MSRKGIALLSFYLFFVYLLSFYLFIYLFVIVLFIYLLSFFICMEEKVVIRLTLNPGLALTAFQTILSCFQQVTLT